MVLTSEIHIGELFQILAFLVLVIGAYASARSTIAVFKLRLDNLDDEMKKLADIAERQAVQTTRLDNMDRRMSEMSDRLKDFCNPSKRQAHQQDQKNQ